MMHENEAVLMMIILALVQKAGGRIEVTREEADAAMVLFPDFKYGPMPNGNFLMEIKEPS
jgi:hypothetical protein